MFILIPPASFYSPEASGLRRNPFICKTYGSYEKKLQIYTLIFIDMIDRPRISYLSQFFILLGLVIFFMFIGGMFMLVLASSLLHVGLMEVPAALLKPENLELNRWTQFIGTLISFLVPAIIFSLIVSFKPGKYLGFSFKISPTQIVFVVLILIGAFILSNSLSEFSQKLPLSNYLKQKAGYLEQEYMQQVKALATMKNLNDYFISLFIIAILPAFFEEALFRGCLQNVLVGWIKRPFWAILITSILFSAIHLSIYGFLSRMALSIILGYVFYYSKSLWLNILFHFLNNGCLITVVYYYIKQGKSIEKAVDTPMPIWYGVLALLLLLAVFQLFRKESKKTNPIDPNHFLKQEISPFT
jgi:membrane protease YdiL (CAAX protease family)